MTPEIKAMVDIESALKELEPDAVRRVMTWANQRFQVKPTHITQVTPADPTQPTPADGAVPGFSEFHELFDAANPSTSLDKVLVAGYWFQVVKNNEDLDSTELNRSLKHLGHPSSNVTRDLDHLMNRTPRLVMQVSKGPTKAARKRYKLTREGVRAVERMVLANQGNGNGNGSH